MQENKLFEIFLFKPAYIILPTFVLKTLDMTLYFISASHSLLPLVGNTI